MGATVRFQRSVYYKETGASEPLDSKIATLEFTYKSNLEMDEEDRIENPLGFRVTSYRVENDYAASPPLEIAKSLQALDNAAAAASHEPFESQTRTVAPLRCRRYGRQSPRMPEPCTSGTPSGVDGLAGPDTRPFIGERIPSRGSRA